MPRSALDTDPNVFVISNRLPVSVQLLENGTFDFKVSSGGLVGALQGLSQSTRFKWYGWPGIDVPDAEKKLVREELAKRNAVPIFLTGKVADKHYNGFSS